MQVDQVVDVVERAFGDNEYPGDAWLQGSREGEEPFKECGAFVGQTDWRALAPEFLDQHYVVLSFFSEAGFRFFMPAFLIADLRDQLRTADPVFHLVGGFSDFSVTHRVGDRDFVIRSGSTQFINPRRYGASRFIDYARQRLSVFCREEAAAIVSYLEHVMSVPSRVPSVLSFTSLMPLQKLPNDSQGVPASSRMTFGSMALKSSLEPSAFEHKTEP